MNLSEYLSNCAKGPIFEALDIVKVQGLMSSYLSKKGIYTVPMPVEVNWGGKQLSMLLAFTDKGEAAGAMFQDGHIIKVGFTKSITDVMANMMIGNEDIDFEVGVEANGANNIVMLKLIENVLNGNIKMTAADLKKQIKSAQLFESVNEEMSPEELDKAKRRLYVKINYAKKRGKDTSDLQAELDALKVINKPKVAVVQEPEIDAWEDELEERATPEERFEDMEAYIGNVIKGIRPLALLCGAPGVGKTFRVMKNVKGRGLQQNIDYKLLKGKITPTQLYKTLHDFKNSGQLVIFDDCDNIFKDDDAINLVKAAFDSADERWVSWGTATSIPMDEETAAACDDAYYNTLKDRWEYPKEFLYEGGGIIITNYNAGQIDTAIRNRALICDLAFTPEEIISLIEGLAPKIKPDELSNTAKEKALSYLKEMVAKGKPVELSIRSFTLCAGLFDSDAPEKTVRRQIAEQMRLASLRGGRKY